MIIIKLNIKNFLESSDKVMNFDGKLENQETKYDISDLNLKFPIEYKGTIYDIDKEILLDLYIKYKYNTQCDRCLKPILKEEDSNFKGYLLKGEYPEAIEESDVQYFELNNDYEILLDDIIISQIITDRPFKNLCDEDCRGLCPQCGQDLNNGNCDCDKNNNIDIRFEKLKNLFNDEEV
ncbi:MAG: YceD family protein [Peptoniphilaceae bacterium]